MTTEEDSVTPRSSDGQWWVGIDVGGTFTDVVAVDYHSGETRDAKVLTTRDAQERGVLEALRAAGVPISSIREIVHGHTVGINAVLSRQGANAALIATAGHRDLLDIGRMDREFGPRFYDPTWLRPHQERPLIPREHRYGAIERTGWDASEIVPLDEDRLRETARSLRSGGIQSVAICLLNSYLDQGHEQRAAEVIREECPDLYTQTSALYPVTKEHERTTTVALDAYVGPLVTGYLKRLEEELATRSFAGSLWIMTMNGGVGSVYEASKAPVFQLESGPVGGVGGAVHVTRTTPFRNLLAMDVGGTSTEAAAIREGQMPLTDLWSVEHGLTMTMPAVDVNSIGSGAGSVIRIDSVGTLRVGPESAGADPGPACYQRGGEQPTLTDACVVLGLLPPDLFAGGALKLDPELAERALRTVADPLGMSVEELADGAYQLACSDIAGSIRSISTYRGLDTRDFALLAYGAAGPMVADNVARDLGVERIVVPPSPGEFSAFGLLASDLRVTKARSPMAVLSSYQADRLEEDYKRLEHDVVNDLAQQGVKAEDVKFDRAIFAMYAGQTWDNRLPLASGPIDETRRQALEVQIHEFYRSRYGFSAEELPILVTTLEVTGVALRDTPPGTSTAHEGEPTVLRTGPVRVRGAGHPAVPLYARSSLGKGNSVAGPALIVEDYATTYVDAGSTAHVDESNALHVAVPTVGREVNR